MGVPSPVVTGEVQLEQPQGRNHEPRVWNEDRHAGTRSQQKADGHGFLGRRERSQVQKGCRAESGRDVTTYWIPT